MQTETQPNDIESPAGNRKTRYAVHVVRILLGLMFLIFGLNGFLNFMPAPKEMPADQLLVIGALSKAGYITVVAAFQLLIGILLLVNRFVPLALAFLAPIIVGILTYHVYLAPSTIAPGIVVLALELYLAWAYRNSFRPMLRATVSPTAN